MRHFLLHFAAVAALAPGLLAAEKIRAPRVWTDKDLKDWATPVAGLNLRPGHYSEREYYAAPMFEALRTYPVYFPGREPAGYFEEVRKRRPEPLLSTGARTRKEWIEHGRRVFREMDVPLVRSTDADLIALVRSAEAFSKAGARPQADGTVAGLRWVPTSKGLALGVEDCGGCHSRVMDDGSRFDGLSTRATGNAVLGQLASRAIQRVYGDTMPVWHWRSFAVPWLPNDVHAPIRDMQPQDLRNVFRKVVPGTFARFNGSPHFPTKTPDLIGIGEHRYLDATATHRLRNIGDLMRYAALVGCCDSADFGEHRMLTGTQRRVVARYSDEVLFALASYIYSLEPPANPNLGDARIPSGKRVFEAQGCGLCHTPPHYTNHKLTVADGFIVPPGHPLRADIMHVSVGTDPGLALRTRKGTGLYKAPSLKGVWYRQRFQHDGQFTSLEEWFDPARIGGHRFGLELSAEDRAALIAFLKSL